MTPELTNRLNAVEYDEHMKALLHDIKNMLKRSRGRMKESYRRWDRNLSVFKGMRIPDESDYETVSNDEPPKLVVPLSFTQSMTFVTFVFMLYKQNQTFFQIGSVLNENIPLEELAENLIEHDLRRNQWNSKLSQLLLDIARFGFCCVKNSWEVKKRYVPDLGTATSQMIDGITVTTPALPTVKEIIEVEGNKLSVVSPYRCYVDTSVPLVRWREGRFVADEESKSIQVLKDLELQGILAGTEFIEKLDEREYKDSEWCAGSYLDVEMGFSKSGGGTGEGAIEDRDDFMCIMTEGHFKLIPSKYGLGKENYLCDFQINLVNDQRFVRIERLDLAHGQFMYDIGMFLPDVHTKLGMALCDPIDALQECVTFLFNSRMASIRQGIDRHFIVDPTKIEMTDLEARSPVIRLKKNVSANLNGIAGYIQQVKYSDGTQSHFQEADQISRIIQTITGVNENAMGQYAPGRRSAAENRAANSGAASRMTFHSSLIWDDCIAPMGVKILSNQRQELSQEVFQRLVGLYPPTPGYDINTYYGAFHKDLPSLIGREDFFVYNGTTPSEKVYLAQALQELVQALMSNPDVIPLMGYDPSKLIDEIQYLRGVRNVTRFKLQPPVGGPGLGAAPPIGGISQAGAQQLGNPALPSPMQTAGAAIA